MGGKLSQFSTLWGKKLIVDPGRRCFKQVFKFVSHEAFAKLDRVLLLVLFSKKAEDNSASHACLTRNNSVLLTRPLCTGFTSVV